MFNLCPWHAFVRRPKRAQAPAAGAPPKRPASSRLGGDGPIPRRKVQPATAPPPRAARAASPAPPMTLATPHTPAVGDKANPRTHPSFKLVSRNLYERAAPKTPSVPLPKASRAGLRAKDKLLGTEASRRAADAFLRQMRLAEISMSPSPQAARSVLQSYTRLPDDHPAFARTLDRDDLHVAREVQNMQLHKEYAHAMTGATKSAAEAQRSLAARRWCAYNEEYTTRMLKERAERDTSLAHDNIDHAKKTRHLEDVRAEGHRLEDEERQAELAALSKRNARRKQRERHREAELIRLDKLQKQRAAAERSRRIRMARQAEDEERRRQELEQARRKEEARQEAERRRLEEELENERRRKEETRRRKEEEEELARVVAAFKAYDEKWAVLKSSDAPSNIGGEHMPWPTLHAVNQPDHITYERVKEFIFHPLWKTMEGKTLKERVKAELLKWHPDKFNRLTLMRIYSDHRECAQQCAAVISRLLTQLLEEAQA